MEMGQNPTEVIMPHPRYRPDEIAARGLELYECDIRALVEPEHTGQYLVVDIETGDYELDEDPPTVTERAATRWPGALLYGLRVGHPAWGHVRPVGRGFSPSSSSP